MHGATVSVVVRVAACERVMWLAIDLVWLPFIGSFAYDTSSPFAGKGLLEAL